MTALVWTETSWEFLRNGLTAIFDGILAVVKVFLLL